MKQNPDFEQLKKVLLRQGNPDKIPFYEHFIDIEVIEKITGIPITKYEFNTGIPVGKSDSYEKNEKEKYLKILINFYYEMGYDYFPLEVSPYLPRTNFLVGDDTAELSREKRQWQDENTGPITNWKEFEKYPWPKENEILDYSYFEIASKNLPNGMKIIGNIAGGVFEHLSWLMGLVPLSYALYDKPDLVQSIVDKVGEIIYTADKNIIQICGEKLGAVKMGDDMGYKTSTMMPPEILKKYIFPWQKKIVELVHQNKLPFILHSCGYLEEIMDDNNTCYRSKKEIRKQNSNIRWC